MTWDTNTQYDDIITKDILIIITILFMLLGIWMPIIFDWWLVVVREYLDTQEQCQTIQPLLCLLL